MNASLISQALAQAIPNPEAEELGMRLARTGALAELLPAVAAKEREELVAEHPDWSDADKAALRATADEVAHAAINKISAAIGNEYALNLSMDDLHALVAFNESPLAKRWREITPSAVAQAMTAAGDVDFKDEAWAAYCAKTGKDAATG